MKTKVTSIRAGDLKESVQRAVTALDVFNANSFSGRRVLVKANFNSPHRYPASSDPAFLAALVLIIREAGAASIIIGDSCGLKWRPAAAVFEKLGVPGLCSRVGAECVDFDRGPWKDVPVRGSRFDSVPIASAALESDIIVYASCMKTHPAARFSLSLKHTIGFLPPEYRLKIHRGPIEENIAEINLAVRPDLVLIDARKCFVSGGPALGWVRRPGLILASTDRVAADVEGLKILSSYFGFNRLLDDPWRHPQIRHSVSLGIGAADEAAYEVVRG